MTLARKIVVVELPCACCGSDIHQQTRGQRVTCNECRAINTIAIDEDGDAHVVGWVCEHGKSDEEPCDQCEVEAGIAV